MSKASFFRGWQRRASEPAKGRLEHGPPPAASSEAAAVPPRAPPPGFSEAFQRALAAHGQGRVEDAIREFREALRLSPRSAAAHGNLAILLAKAGRAQEAVTEFQAALEADPTDDGAYFQLGMLLTQLGRPAQAAAAYKGFLAHAERAPQEYKDYARRQIQRLEAPAAAGPPAAPEEEKRGAGLWVSPWGRVAAPTLGAGTALGTAADVAGLRGLALRAAASNPILAGAACVLAAASVLIGLPWAIATRGAGDDRRPSVLGPVFAPRAPADRLEEQAPGQAEDAPAPSSLMSFADKIIASPPAPAPAAARDASAPALPLGPPHPAAAPTAGASASPKRAAAEKPRLPADPGASGGFSGQFHALQRRAGSDVGTGVFNAGPAHAIHAERAIGQLQFAKQQALKGSSAGTDAAAAALGDSSFAQQTPRGAEADEELSACMRNAKPGSGAEACLKEAQRRRGKPGGDGRTAP